MLCGATLLVAILATPVCSQDQANADLQELVDAVIAEELNAIEGFVVNVLLQGSAEQIGLEQEELVDFAKIRYRKNMDLPFLTDLGPRTLNSIGTIIITVWTVGEDYPIAFHIQLMGGSMSDLRLHSDAILGYDSRKGIERQAKDSIEQLIERFAAFFVEKTGHL